mmetsp:Transcript_11417/g.39843  ORF Transcript_11417/g.39843 Transcript_11417/m.39843 type:complete len:314 (-) Transcript_11417:42-983(-)
MSHISKKKNERVHIKVLPSQIGNKVKRAQVMARIRQEKRRQKVEKRRARDEEREALGDAAPKAAPARTLDNTREYDDTIVAPGDAEVVADEAADEFAPYFAGEKEPKIMITTAYHATAPTFRFIRDLMSVLPNAYYYKRGAYQLKDICKWAAKAEFTHLLVLAEKSKKLNGLYISHLPDGPTAFFKLSTAMESNEIKGHGNPTSHLPEIILNNFNTRLGHRVGRLFGSLFPHKPEFIGRRVVTFHNQRDFIFVRHHRYIFNEDGTRARLQELGPRFTLKMRWLQACTFDTNEGEYEWVHKRKEMDTSRRRFHL